MASEGGNDRDDRESPDLPPAARPATDAPKLRRIEITNYKAIDHLVLDVPAPTMPGDPDIFVVGSKNGVGKTSLLECCALARLVTRHEHSFRHTVEIQRTDEQIAQLIRTGAPMARVQVSQTLDEDLAFQLTRTPEHFAIEGRRYAPPDPQQGERYISMMLDGTQFPGLADELFGISPNCLIHPELLYFHSFRKVAEGPLPMHQMLREKANEDSRPVSALKLKILRTLMARAGLFEDVDNRKADLLIERLNRILRVFTGGRVDRLRVASEQIDIRITNSQGLSFSFDGLSSGQKESVSTLFLIEDATRDLPALVLIDEPELHLNAEWQCELIHQLHTLAPQNQYILATHSEDIFASVPEDRRVLLGPQG